MAHQQDRKRNVAAVPPGFRPETKADIKRPMNDPERARISRELYLQKLREEGVKTH